MTDLGLFESAAVYRAARPRAHALGALLTGRRARAGAAGPAGGLLRRQGLLAAVLDALRVDVDRRAPAASRACTRAAPRAVLVGDERGRLGRRGPPARRRALGHRPGRVAAFDARPRPGRARCAPEVTHLRATDHASRRCARTSRWSSPTTCPRRGSSRSVRGAGGELLPRAEVFDVYRGEQLGEGSVSLALHLEFRAPDRTLTDEDVAPVREKIVAALRERAGGGAAWLSRRSSSPAPAATRARSPRALVHRHPELRADRGDLAQRRGPPARRPLPAPPRAAASSTRSTSTSATADVDAAIVAYPHGAAAPVVAAAARARRQGRRPLAPTSACATSPIYEEWYVEHPRARAVSPRPSTACPSCYRDEIARRATSSPTPAATRPRRSSRSPRWRRYLRRRRHRREVRRQRRRPRAPPRPRTSSRADENVTPYSVGRHRHTPEIDQELGRRAAEVAAPSPRTWSRSTRASWSPAT